VLNIPALLIDHKNTASMMVKEKPNQTASLIATTNDAIVYLKMGELNITLTALRSRRYSTKDDSKTSKPQKHTCSSL
jgi:hypothetical protein